MSTPATKSLASRLLSQRGKPAPCHTVTVRLTGKDDKGADCVSDADAVLVFVTDLAAHKAQDAATAALGGKPASIDRASAEQAYYLLAEALRASSEARAERFFASAEEAKALLVDKEAVRLMNEYRRFVEVHYPDTLSESDFKAIQEAAKDHFLSDLLTSFGTLPILRALPSLAMAYGAPLTAKS